MIPRWWLLPWICACGACTVLFDTSALGPSVTNGDFPADAQVDAPGDSWSASDGFPSADEDSSAPCPPGPGPVMKRIGVYCIDGNEVTNADYEVFLAGQDAGAGGATHPGCASNDSHVPTTGWPPAAEWRNLPVRGVSWCDAHAYCTWAKKRLCGQRGGGSLAPADTANGASSEWFRACTKGGTRTFPYGDELIGGECATSGHLRLARQGCEGGYLGIYDMVGNVEEWIDSCTGEGPSDRCALMGGSVVDDSARCETAHWIFSRAGRTPLTGFRCCAD